MAVRTSTSFSGWRAALDPARCSRACRHISAWSLVATLGVGAAVLVALIYDPSAFERIQDHAPLQPAPLARARAEAPHDLDQGIAALAARLERAPDDVDGWALLARSYLMVGDNDRAAEASLHVGALRANDPGQLAREAETRITDAGGTVEPMARRLIEGTLALDPANVRARFFEGLAQAQDDQSRQALQTWLALEADAPADAPWLAGLRANIERLVEQTGIPPDTVDSLRRAAAAAHDTAPVSATPPTHAAVQPAITGTTPQ
jgi:cytochrome c-type biogenesis protein CcmH